MIPRKKKICKGCDKERYIFGHGLCQPCYRRPRALSPSSGGKVPPKRDKPKGAPQIKPLSAKRVGQERLYKAVCDEIDREAREKKDLSCFFCGADVVDADRHHLDGRDGELLTKKEWIVRVHRKCHMMYHDVTVHKIWWFRDYLERLAEVDETLYLRGRNKLDK